MPEKGSRTSGKDKDAFGRLVRAYREQRGWSQGQLAERWGFTREYVSQIERGKRQLTQLEQVNRLAEVLEIPQERLAAIGRGIPTRPSPAQPTQLEEADDVLLRALIEPAEATVKLSWLVWYANQDTSVVNNLARITTKLEEAITQRRGTLLKPALRLLAYAHEMHGKIAFDGLDYMQANGHFQEMLELGEEVSDPDLIALAMIHQGDVLRRRGRYDHATRRLEAAATHAAGGTVATQGLRLQTLARAHAEFGQKGPFLRAIDKAQELAAHLEPSLDIASVEFTLVDVIQERAQGHTLLWEPKQALTLYAESEHLQPFRPMRDLGVFVILKAQAYAYAGELEEGLKYALQGLRLAKRYHSRRHITRVQRMYDRLSVTSLGKESSMQQLREALRQL